MYKFVLQWHITHSCNLRCKHCYQSDFTECISKENFYTALDKFMTYIADKDVIPQINLTGGEPLLHPLFFEFAREINNRGIKLGILTNGTLIDEVIVKKIAELKPLFVQISIDGTRDIHDEIRGKGNFDKALHAVDLLNAQGVKVMISFTAHRLNYRCFERLADICYQHKVYKLWWDRVVIPKEEDIEHLSMTTDAVKELVKITNNLRLKYNFISNERALQFIGTNDCGYICGAGGNLLIVLANGDVMPCRRLPFVIGNIYAVDLDAMIKGSELMQELKSFYAPTECRSCRYFMRCRGGAKCVTYAQTLNLYQKDVNCWL